MSDPEAPAGAAPHPQIAEVEHDEEAARVGPSVPRVERIGSTAEPRTGEVIADELSAHDWSEVRRQARRRLARQAGILADVVVNRKAITPSQKDEVVALLRECEKELIDAS